MSKTELSIKDWKEKLRKMFKVHLKRCNPTWTYFNSQNWPITGTVSLFKTKPIYEILAQEVVRKSSETAVSESTPLYSSYKGA